MNDSIINDDGMNKIDNNRKGQRSCEKENKRNIGSAGAEGQRKTW